MISMTTRGCTWVALFLVVAACSDTQSTVDRGASTATVGGAAGVGQGGMSGHAGAGGASGDGRDGSGGSGQGGSDPGPRDASFDDGGRGGGAGADLDASTSGTGG